jgi:molybdenum cofactor cytidylyltransferase
MDDIWAIVLAAGESKRMGFPKMLLPFNGSTMVENVINTITVSGIVNIMVVLGAERESIIERIGKSTVQYCYNEQYREGMLSSVKCGFRNIPSDCKAILVFQGDQPMISDMAINALVEAYLHSEKGIVIPVFRTKRGHPLLVDMKYRDEIEKLSPAIGLRSLAEEFSRDVLEVETNDPGILRDFDTYDEYIKEINQTL